MSKSIYANEATKRVPISTLIIEIYSVTRTLVSEIKPRSMSIRITGGMRGEGEGFIDKVVQNLDTSEVSYIRVLKLPEIVGNKVAEKQDITNGSREKTLSILLEILSSTQ